MIAKRQKSRQLLRGVLKVLKRAVGPHRHVYLSLPESKWGLPELNTFCGWCRARGHAVQRVTINGCMYGIMSQEVEGTHLRKSWTILTTDPRFESACGRRCDGSHIHTGRLLGIDKHGHDGLYPDAMGRAIAKHSGGIQGHLADLYMAESAARFISEWLPAKASHHTCTGVPTVPSVRRIDIETQQNGT